MKLKNKKTGEIGLLRVNNYSPAIYVDSRDNKVYYSLAELNEEWEDYKETEGYWFIRDGGNIDYHSYKNTEITERRKEIGNYFNTEEEAELAVKKLKAWKELKDKGFKLKDWFYDVTYVLRDSQQHKEGWSNDITIRATCKSKIDKEILDLLFGGEEDD